MLVRETDIVQFRYAPGGLQYRQRLLETADFPGVDPQYIQVLSSDWTDWQFIHAVKGDDTDVQFV